MKTSSNRLIFTLATLSLMVLPLSGCGHAGAGGGKAEAQAQAPAARLGASQAETTVVRITPDEEATMNIQLEPVGRHTLDFEVKTTGEVLANLNTLTHVNSPVTGRATEVLVSPGMHVNAGQPLLYVNSAELEDDEATLLQNKAQVSADLKRDLVQIDADIAQAQAELKLSDGNFNRVKTLVDEKIASQAQYETAKTAFEKDQIALEGLRKKRDNTLSLSDERMRLLTQPIKTKLKLLGVNDATIAKVLRTNQIDPAVPIGAPESGTISERKINNGELIDQARCLFTIGDFRSVWLKADIYEKDIPKVAQNEQCVLQVDSFPGEKFYGKIDYMADSVDPDSRTLLVRADVSNPGLKLKPKMFGEMQILTGKQSMLAIPKTAVQEAGSYQVVYVFLKPGAYEERRVKLGAEAENMVEVIGGLQPGERIATNGSFALRAQALKEED
jgi:cobalt-zinc-cadmium efflux system membrane fusion protein